MSIENTKITFFSSPTCIKCGKAKSYLAEQLAKLQIEHELEHVDASTSEGLQKAQEMDVSSVPTIFFQQEEKQFGRASDLDEIDAVLKDLK